MASRIVLLALFCSAAAMAENFSTDEVVPEMDISLMGDDEILAAAATSQAAAAGKEKANEKEAIEVSAMDQLKAYCQVAAQSKFFKKTQDKHKNAIMAVVGEYSKNPLSNKHLAGGSANNIVTQYGLMMGNLEGKRRGMFKYILTAIDDAILQGKSPITSAPMQKRGDENPKPKTYQIFDAKLLGFETTPDYFFKFKVTPEAFGAAMAAIPKGQTAKAIAARLMKDKKTFYQTALDRLIAEHKAAEKKAYDGAVKDSHTAIHKALTEADDKLDNQEVLHPLTTKGTEAVKANKAYMTLQQPAMAALKKQALSEARAKVRAEAATANASRLTKETEEKARLAAIERAKKEADAKERANKEKTAKEKAKKEAAAKAAAAAERASKEYATKHARDGQCCCYTFGSCFGVSSCSGCYQGNEYVGLGSCGSSRRCSGRL